MKIQYFSITLIYSIVLLSCQSRAEHHTTAAPPKAVASAETPFLLKPKSPPFFLSGTYVCQERSVFQQTDDTLWIAKRRDAATIYTVTQHMSCRRLREKDHSVIHFYADQWIASYDEENTILYRISKGERLLVNTEEGRLQWNGAVYSKIE